MKCIRFHIGIIKAICHYPARPFPMWSLMNQTWISYCKLSSVLIKSIIFRHFLLSCIFSIWFETGSIHKYHLNIIRPLRLLRNKWERTLTSNYYLWLRSILEDDHPIIDMQLSEDFNDLNTMSYLLMATNVEYVAHFKNNLLLYKTIFLRWLSSVPSSTTW